MLELMHNTITNSSGIVLFAGVGERSREGNDMWLDMNASGLIDSAILAFGQMNEPPGARLRIPFTALTMAEYFRDEENRPVLIFIDNIYRFIQAGSEVSALLGRLPSEMGYQSTLDSEMGSLQERITSTSSGSITSVQAVYIPADDVTDPAVAATFSHLDATTVLSRRLVSLGLYPAIDPLQSSSNLLTPEQVGRDHYEVAMQVRATLARYEQAYKQHAEHDRRYARVGHIANPLEQTRQAEHERKDGHALAGKEHVLFKGGQIEQHE